MIEHKYITTKTCDRCGFKSVTENLLYGDPEFKQVGDKHLCPACAEKYNALVEEFFTKKDTIAVSDLRKARPIGHCPTCKYLHTAFNEEPCNACWWNVVDGKNYYEPDGNEDPSDTMVFCTEPKGGEKDES